MSFGERIEKLNEVQRGWVNNFRMASIHGKLKELDGWFLVFSKPGHRLPALLPFCFQFPVPEVAWLFQYFLSDACSKKCHSNVL